MGEDTDCKCKHENVNKDRNVNIYTLFTLTFHVDHLFKQIQKIEIIDTKHKAIDTNHRDNRYKT